MNNAYHHHEAEDFARDPEFVKWVKHPEKHRALSEAWKDWMERNPDRRKVIEEARNIVLAVISEPQYFDEAESRKGQVWSRVQETLEFPQSKESRLDSWKVLYRIAAAVLLILVAGASIWWINFEKQEKIAATNEHAPTLVKFVNNGTTLKTIVLSDHSSIVLQPQAELEYPQVFDADRREVYLKGEGFFEVTKDPGRPFRVHANEITTEVLGTSFTVRNVRSENIVKVLVKTGKVSVFKQKNKDAQDTGTVVDGVVLLPNQQVDYQRKEEKMVKSLVENPTVLSTAAQWNFEFVDTPVGEVFDALEHAYGVDILFDEEVMKHCVINASLDDIPLYDKLKLTCKTIGATYEIIDSHIIVHSKGCDGEN